MRKVLLINDSKLENKIMRDILDSINYEVCIADEYNAIAAVRDFCPDYIIANYIMREINGAQLAAMIKIKYPNIKCIISSSNPMDIKSFDRRKINAVIKTPIDRMELKRVLESVAEESENESDIYRNESYTYKNESDTSGNSDVNKCCKQCGKAFDFNTFLFCPFCGNKL